MRSDHLRFRQVHLDFHTSEHIPDIGADFDPEEFARTLERARVNSVTCFARCHHGWIYFDTQSFPERRHPHLSRDLLREQIEACHARNIRVPIYVTVQWDDFTAREHPEWRVVTAEGCLEGTPPYQAGFYRKLCLNSPYRDFLRDHVREILQTLPADGLFFDIVQPVECSCRHCRTRMEERGLDPTKPGARQSFGLETINNFKLEMTRFVHSFNPDCTIFYNSGHIGPRHRAVKEAYTHFELETLPSGGWGYEHFPVSVRYARTLGLDYLGQTGKFHTSWGDFHSFKNPAALQYECFRMLALGAKCEIGDQLHPTGKIDKYVYDLVGDVYSEIEKKEPWCEGARAVTEIAVMTPEEFTGGGIGNLPPAIKGATRMLEEGAHQFDIIDSNSDLLDYKVVILPDNIPVSTELAEKLENYQANGGALIASFASGLNPEAKRFSLKTLGISLQQDGSLAKDKYSTQGKHFPNNDFCDYILPKGEIGRGLPETEHAMYIRGMDVNAEPDSEILAETILSYFDRTYEHFCSHRQTPSSGRVGSPAITRNGRSIYFSHPIFTQYERNAPLWCKRLFLNALDLLLPEPLIRHNGPSTMRVTVNEQPAKNRWILHLLHYIPERRGQDFDVIEDVIPLFNIQLLVRVPRNIREATLVPDGKSIPFKQADTFKQADNSVELTLQKLSGHQMICLELER